MSEKKSRYTPAQKKAAEKYLSEKVENIQLRVPVGQKALIKEHASIRGESLNRFLLRAIEETIQNDLAKS